MAVIKRIVGQITLEIVKDVASTTYFYLLMPSTAAAPSKPTTSPPPVYETEGYDGWQTTEPSYTNGDTRSLYITVRTVYSDGSFEYSDPSLSSSYEAAKAAYNRAQSALSLAGDMNQYFWDLSSAYDTDVPAGIYVTSIPQSTFKTNKTGGNVLIQSTGITLRDGATQLASLTGSALNFYNPSTGNAQLTIGANGALQSGNYTRGSNNKFSSSGTKIDLTSGDIITQYFRLSQGGESGGPTAGAYIHGTIEALDGSIGSNATNYWEIGNYTDYNLSGTAKIIGHGSSFIQLGDSSTWRLSTNRIHTGWHVTSDALLHFPEYTDGNSTLYWDYGFHTPTSKDDKFIYIRTAPNSTSLSNLLYDIDDSFTTHYWTYKLWIDGSGNIHAPGFYIGDSTTPIGGGTGTIAEKIINSDSTYGKGSTTQPVYVDSNGRVQTIGYTIAKSVPSDAKFTDTVTTVSVTGDGNAITSMSATNGAITATKDSTFLLNSARGAANGVVPLNASSKIDSTYLPSYVDDVLEYNGKSAFPSTGEAGKIYVDTSTNKTYRWGGSTYVEISQGSVVTISRSLTSGTKSATITIDGTSTDIYAPTNTNTTYTFADGTNGFTVTPSGGTAQTVTVTPSITNNVTGSGTSGYLTKWNGTNTITNGPALSSTGTRYLKEDGSWGTPGGTYSLPLAASGTRGGVQIGYSESGTNYAVKLSNEKMYVSVPWVDTTYTLSNTLSSHKFTTTLTPSSGDATTATQTFAAGGAITLTDDTTNKKITIAHTDTSSQASSSNSGRTYIQSVTLDTYGHVTGLSTATETVTDTHYTANLITGAGTTAKTNAAATSGSVYLNLIENDTVRNSHQITGSGTVSVASDANGKITITGSAHPTTLPNPKSLKLKVYSGTSTSSDTTYYGGETNNTEVSVAGVGAITGISASAAAGGSTTFTLTKANGTTSTFDVTVTASVATGATKLTDSSGNTISEGSATNPVYFSAGVPVSTTYSLNKTVPSNAVFTDTWIAMVGATSSANGTAGYVSAPPKDGYNTKFLRADGTWVVPGGTYSLPLAANGTRGGVQIGYTTSGKNYAVQLSSEKMYVNVPWENTTYSAGTGLSLSGTTINHSNSVTAGTAGTSSATSSTNRTIAIPYVTYDAQGHVTGSGTHTHTLDSFPEAYLAWGGRNINADVTPVGASLSAEHSANRLAYLNPAAIQIEYTTDGGSNWIDSGYTDAEKTWLCTGSQSIAIGQSKSGYSASTALTTNNWTRITLTGQNGTTQYVYTNPRKLLVNMSTALSINCLIEYKTGVSGASWQTFGTYAVSGWSGWNDIPLILGTFGGGSTQTNNNWYLRFTFKVNSTRTDSYKGMANVYGLRLFGTNNWGSASSNYGKGPISSTGHLYNYDVNANATFPASILPATNNSANLGSSSYKWANVYATTLNGSLAWSNVSGKPTATGSSTTGISISDHSTTTITGVSGSTTASKVTLGTALSIPNVTGATDVTVPIKNSSATTVPIKNASATSIPNVTNVGSLTFAIDGTDDKQLNITFNAPTLGTAISIIGVQSSTTSVIGVQSSTTTASKVTLGTNISVPNVTAATDVTVPKAATSATTVVTGKTHTITDGGHTHTIS